MLVSRSPRSSFLLGLIIALAGCEGDGEGGGGEGETEGSRGVDSGAEGPGSPEEGSGGSSGTPPDNSGGSSTSADDDDSTGTGDPILPTGDLAPGIAVGRVVANQAVDIDLMVDGQVTSDADRVAPLISGRPLLVRAEYVLDSEFSARTIIGRLRMEHGDGTVSTFDDPRAIQGPGSLSTLGGTFHWVVRPEDVRGDTSFRIELLEEEGVSGLPGSTTVRPICRSDALPPRSAVRSVRLRSRAAVSASSPSASSPDGVI